MKSHEKIYFVYIWCLFTVLLKVLHSFAKSFAQFCTILLKVLHSLAMSEHLLVISSISKVFFFIIYTLFEHHLHIICTLFAYYLHIICTLFAHYLYIIESWITHSDKFCHHSCGHGLVFSRFKIILNFETLCGGNTKMIRQHKFISKHNIMSRLCLACFSSISFETTCRGDRKLFRFIAKQSITELVQITL